MIENFFYYQNGTLRRGRQTRRGDVGSQADSRSSISESQQENKAVSEPYEREHGGTGCGQQSNHASGHQIIQAISEFSERPRVGQARIQVTPYLQMLRQRCHKPAAAAAVNHLHEEQGAPKVTHHFATWAPTSALGDKLSDNRSGLGQMLTDSGGQ